MTRIIVLLLLCTPILSAPDPNGCIESCLNQRLASLRGASQNLDYTRPGNWSEHNQFVTDGGRGKIHEEHGQYVDDSKQLRYFKKNYSASFGSADALGTGLSSDRLSNYNSHRLSSGADIFQTANREHAAFIQSHAQKMQSLAASSNTAFDELKRIMEASQNSFKHHSAVSSRLEDFGHAENTLDLNHPISTRPKVGGGQERVYEEHGQVQTGPTHVKYYKKNYTANYSSLVPFAVSSIDTQHVGAIGRGDIEVSSGLHQANHDLRSEGRLVSGNSQQYQNSYGHQSSYNTGVKGGQSQQQYLNSNRGSSSGYGIGSETSTSEHLNAYKSSKQVHEVPTTSTHYNLRSDSQNYGGIHESSYQQQVQHPQRSSYLNRDSNTRVSSDHASLREESLIHGSGLTGSQHRGFGNLAETLPQSNRGHVRKYEEHHSQSSHYKESIEPHYGTDGILQKQQQLTHQQLAQQQLNNHDSSYQSSGYAQHGSYYNHGRNTFVGQSQSSGAQSFGTPSEKLVVGMLDLGHTHGVDCVGEESHAQYSSQYHRKS